MIKVLMSLIFGASLMLGTSFAQTPTAAPVAAAPVAATTETVKPAHHEHHPELHKAMRKLRGAKQDLEKAASDYGGHKVKAIEAIDRALEELKDALEADKK